MLFIKVEHDFFFLIMDTIFKIIPIKITNGMPKTMYRALNDKIVYNALPSYSISGMIMVNKKLMILKAIIKPDTLSIIFLLFTVTLPFVNFQHSYYDFVKLGTKKFNGLSALFIGAFLSALFKTADKFIRLKCLSKGFSLRRGSAVGGGEV